KARGWWAARGWSIGSRGAERAGPRLRRQTYSAVQPPSRTRAAPVINDDASEARKTIAPVNSSSCPSRPSLILESTSSRKALFSKNGRVIGVCRKVGPGLLERMLWGAGELDRHRFGQPFHGVLAGAIDGAARRSDVPHLRRDVDDRAAAFGLDQAACDRLRHEEGGTDVERKNDVEVLDLDVHQRGRA